MPRCPHRQVLAPPSSTSLAVFPFQGRERGSKHFRPIAHEIDKNEVENPLYAFCVVVSASLATRPLPSPPQQLFNTDWCLLIEWNSANKRETGVARGIVYEFTAASWASATKYDCSPSPHRILAFSFSLSAVPSFSLSFCLSNSPCLLFSFSFLSHAYNNNNKSRPLSRYPFLLLISGVCLAYALSLSPLSPCSPFRLVVVPL